jgi:hypothetical protein
VEGTEQPLHDDYVYAVKDEEAYGRSPGQPRTSWSRAWSAALRPGNLHRLGRRQACGHHHHQPLRQARAVDTGGGRRAGAVRPQGHGRPRLWRPGPRRRAAGLGRHPRRRRRRRLAARGRVDHQRTAPALLPQAGLYLCPYRRPAPQPLGGAVPAASPARPDTAPARGREPDRLSLGRAASSSRGGSLVLPPRPG